MLYLVEKRPQWRAHFPQSITAVLIFLRLQQHTTCWLPIVTSRFCCCVVWVSLRQTYQSQSDVQLYSHAHILTAFSSCICYVGCHIQELETHHGQVWRGNAWSDCLHIRYQKLYGCCCRVCVCVYMFVYVCTCECLHCTPFVRSVILA